MYDHAQHTHQYSIRMKDKYRQNHPLEHAGSSAGASASASTSASVTSTSVSSDAARQLHSQRESETHPLDILEYHEIPEPQVRVVGISQSPTLLIAVFSPHSDMILVEQIGSRSRVVRAQCYITACKLLMFCL